MDEEKYISSDALLKRLKNQAEVLTKTPEEFALLDKVMTIIRSEPAVNQKREPEDDWETVEVPTSRVAPSATAPAENSSMYRSRFAQIAGTGCGPWKNQTRWRGQESRSTGGDPQDRSLRRIPRCGIHGQEKAQAQEKRHRTPK